MKKSRNTKRLSKSNKSLGNPAVALSVLQSPLAQTAIKGIALAGASYLAYRLITGGIEQAKKNKVASQYGDNTTEGLAAQYAAQLYQAVDGPGTNETLIFNTANAMYRNGVSFDLVNKAYKNLYGANLIEDLQGDLNSSEYEQFNKILRGQQLFGTTLTGKGIKGVIYL